MVKPRNQQVISLDGWLDMDGGHAIRKSLAFSTETAQDTPAVTGITLVSLYIMGEEEGSQGNSKRDGGFEDLWAVVVYQNIRTSFSKPHRCMPAEDQLCSYPQFRVHKSSHLGKDGKEEENEEVGWVCPWGITGPVLLEKRDKGKCEGMSSEKKSRHMAF